ncbi:MAG: hypothetical protein AABZ47_16145 [Planctomycetota bacterium]
MIRASLVILVATVLAIHLLHWFASEAIEGHFQQRTAEWCVALASPSTPRIASTAEEPGMVWPVLVMLLVFLLIFKVITGSPLLWSPVNHPQDTAEP